MFGFAYDAGQTRLCSHLIPTEATDGNLHFPVLPGRIQNRPYVSLVDVTLLQYVSTTPNENVT